MTDIDNRGIGDNIGTDVAETVNDRLSLTYAEHRRTLDKMLAEAAERVPLVTSDEMALARGSLIKRFKDLDTRLESHREAEKSPYLRGGNAVDNFFHSMRDIIGRRKNVARTAKPGIIDVMQDEIDVWQNEKDAKNRARLERERLEAGRIAREEAARLRKAQEEADEAARAAARARSAATQAARSEAAANAFEREAIAKERADLAAEKAKEAEQATMVKTAELTRVRGVDASGAGVLLTTAREGFAILTNRERVDMNALRPYFTDFEIEKALRGWAKAHGFKVEMAGAEIGFRNKGVTR